MELALFARTYSPFRWQLRAARYLDDGGHFSAYEYGKSQDFHTPQVQSKALVVSFLFFTGRGGSFLSPNRERKEWGHKGSGRPMVAPTFAAGTAIKFVGAGIARPEGR